MPRGKAGATLKGLFRPMLLTFEYSKVWKSHSLFGLLFQCFQTSPGDYFYHNMQSGLPLFQLLSVVSCHSCMPPERFGLYLLCKDPLCSYRLQKDLVSLRLTRFSILTSPPQACLPVPDHHGGLLWIDSRMSMFSLHWGHFWKGSHVMFLSLKVTTAQEDRIAYSWLFFSHYPQKILPWEILSLENLSAMYCRGTIFLPGAHTVAASSLLAEGSFCCGCRCRTAPFSCHGSLLVSLISFHGGRYMFVYGALLGLM